MGRVIHQRPGQEKWKDGVEDERRERTVKHSLYLKNGRKIKLKEKKCMKQLCFPSN